MRRFSAPTSAPGAADPRYGGPRNTFEIKYSDPETGDLVVIRKTFDAQSSPKQWLALLGVDIRDAIVKRV